MPYLYTRVSHNTTATHKVVLKVYPPPKDAWDMLHGEYKYRIPKPFPQDKDDLVLRFIKKTIRNLQKADINVAMQHYKIQGLTLHLPVWPLTYGNAQFPTKLYAIRPYWREFSMCISVMVEDRGSMNPTLTLDRVKVQVYPAKAGDRWMTVKEFLELWAAPYPGYRIHPALSDEVALRKWWPMTRKKFPFIELPKEIRLQILVHVLGGEIRPTTVDNPLVGEPTIDFLKKRDSYRSEYAFIPNKAIFGVSKQVRTEAWEAILTGTEKVFYDRWDLEGVLLCRVPPAPASTKWLAKVALKLILDNYFHFFGWQFSPTLTEYPTRPGELAHMLGQCPLLEQLTLDFQNPYVDGRNPWSKLDRYMGYRDNRSAPLHEEWYRYREEGCVPCYRTVVDWILTLAFPYIKGIPKVKLQGAVKTSIKKHWGRILSIEYKKSIGVDPIKTHSFDYATAVAYLRSIPTTQFFDQDWDEERLVNAFDHDDTFQLQSLTDACRALNMDAKRKLDEYRGKFNGEKDLEGFRPGYRYWHDD